jgi:hypothetical protein
MFFLTDFFDGPHIAGKNGFGPENFSERSLSYFLNEFIIFLNRLIGVDLEHIMIGEGLPFGESDLLNGLNSLYSHIIYLQIMVKMLKNYQICTN